MISNCQVKFGTYRKILNFGPRIGSDAKYNKILKFSKLRNSTPIFCSIFQIEFIWLLCMIKYWFGSPNWSSIRNLFNSRNQLPKKSYFYAFVVFQTSIYFTSSKGAMSILRLKSKLDQKSDEVFEISEPQKSISLILSVIKDMSISPTPRVKFWFWNPHRG